MKEWRSFSFACTKIHELPISVFLLSFSVSPLSVSPVFPVSLSLAIFPSLSFFSLSNIHDTFTIPPSPLPPCTPPSSSSLLSLSLSPRFSLSSFCLFVFSLVGVSCVVCGVRAAQCQLRRELGVSRVVRSHRVVRSLASSHRLSSRVVCRLAVRRPAARCQSRRVRSRVGVSRVSSCVVPLVGVSRVVCGVLPP